LLLWEVLHVLAGWNTHTVIDKQLYRSAQLSEAKLREFASENGIKTIVNLRGFNGWEGWYQAESKVAAELGISQEDLTTSANVFPNPNEMRKLVEIYDRSERPLLVHCRRGSDRTGLATGIFLLLYTNANLSDVRWNCSPRYGHFRAMTTARMDEFFDFYEEYLQSIQKEHSPEIFRDWILTKYEPGHFLGNLKLPPQPEWKRDQTLCFIAQAENLSSMPWKMSAGRFVGVHLCYQVNDEAGEIVYKDVAGLFDRVVQPGESVDLEICLPAIKKAGTYYLHFELTGEKHIAFSKIGWQPIVWKFEIR
jgi:protein tyrosine phosphatase (PTP) superfamily phosphohydrolase (DUF442 family)